MTEIRTKFQCIFFMKILSSLNLKTIKGRESAQKMPDHIAKYFHDLIKSSSTCYKINFIQKSLFLSTSQNTISFVYTRNANCVFGFLYF